MSTVQGDDRLEEETPSTPSAPEEPKPRRRATAPRPPVGEETPSAASAPEEPKPRRRAAAPTAPVGEETTSDVSAPEESKPKRGGTATQTGTPAPRRRTRAAASAVAEAPAVEEAPQAAPVVERRTSRMLELYRTHVVPTMIQEFGYGNIAQVPLLQKVVLNIGLGEALTNPKAMESATLDLTTISGQKPIMTRARKSIAAFKLREGNPIGVCVTLRGARMYQFMDRLMNAALPRVRDFRGVSANGFDGRGNYSMGIREQVIFPEIDYAQIERIRGLQVTITTSAKTDGEALRLLSLLGMPFAQQN